MKFFVTGVGGQLGHDVMNELIKRGHEGVGSDIQEQYSGVEDGSEVTKAPYLSLDITDKEAVKRVIESVKPDAVIHCAAWTAVDMAEDDDKVAKVRAINAGGTQNIADVCKKLDCKMTYISTDYVFDGQGTEPWKPDCKDYKPMNVYGQTKLEGELAVSQTLEKYFIVRIAWVFGLNGKNFIKTMLNVGKTHDTVRVVNDQIGTPTYTYDLARLLVDMNETEKYGYYHATNEGGYISWYDFTREIYRQAGYTTRVLPVTTPQRVSCQTDAFYLICDGMQSRLRIRLFEGTLKFFFDHPEDYYYLPAEDMAIHKSVASYVDKEFRKKATASNCYTKKDAIFVPQYETLITPFFKESNKDKLSYFELTLEFLDSDSLLFQYTRHVFRHFLTEKH